MGHTPKSPGGTDKRRIHRQLGLMPNAVLVAKMFSSLRLFYVAKSMRKNQTNCKIPWRQNKNLIDVTLIVQLLEVLSAMEMVTRGVKGPRGHVV